METTLEVRPTVEKEPAPGRAEGRAADRQNSLRAGMSQQGTAPCRAGQAFRAWWTDCTSNLLLKFSLGKSWSQEVPAKTHTLLGPP